MTFANAAHVILGITVAGLLMLLLMSATELEKANKAVEIMTDTALEVDKDNERLQQAILQIKDRTASDELWYCQDAARTCVAMYNEEIRN